MLGPPGPGWGRGEGGGGVSSRTHSLPYFHGLGVVVAEEVVGLVRLDGLSAVHAQVKHCRNEETWS